MRFSAVFILIASLAAHCNASTDSVARRKLAASAPPPKPKKSPATGGGGGGGGGGVTPPSSSLANPPFVGPYVLQSDIDPSYSLISVILGRPTTTTITASLVAHTTNLTAFLEYAANNTLTKRTPSTPLRSGIATEILLTGLKPNTEYTYRLNYRVTASKNLTLNQRPIRRFSTQKTKGSTFVFTVQGDSHPERPFCSHPTLYARTLKGAAQDKPDFHIAIGDDFSTDKLATLPDEDITYDKMTLPYLLQRPFMGIVGETSPIFLVNGNHEQGSLFNYLQSDIRHNVSVGVQRARNAIFPTPPGLSSAADLKFYSFDNTSLPEIGPLKSYVSWTWGDALFVILDNYWGSPAQVDSGFGGKTGPAFTGPSKNRTNWDVTLGDTQYRWLEKTLKGSKAKYKFVFAHHVLGTGRGGVERATGFEWGGASTRGDTTTFAQARPGWSLPVHQLMAKYNTTIFFQGHDHSFCKQKLDNVVYQELPMPSDHTYQAFNSDAYSDPTSTSLPNSGYLRVTVSPSKVKVEYVLSFLPSDEAKGKKQGSIAFDYTV